MKLKSRVIIFVIVVLLFFIGLYMYKNFGGFDGSKVKKVSDSIPEYGYTLTDNQSEIYTKYFKELKNVLNSNSIDEEKYLKLISKMFIIDLYSLDNKIDNKDIGGVEFVYPAVVDNYKDKMADTLYLYVESNLYGKRRQKLPVVKNVTINEINNVFYSYLNTYSDEKAYEVKVNWNYEKDLNYKEEAVLYFIHDGKKLSLVEIK